MNLRLHSILNLRHIQAFLSPKGNPRRRKMRWAGGLTAIIQPSNLRCADYYIHTFAMLRPYVKSDKAGMAEYVCGGAQKTKYTPDAERLDTVVLGDVHAIPLGLECSID